MKSHTSATAGACAFAPFLSKIALIACATAIFALAGCATPANDADHSPDHATDHTTDHTGHSAQRDATPSDAAHLASVDAAHAGRMGERDSYAPRGPATELSCDTVGWTEQITPPHQNIINQMMASRMHRAHHALWHAVRGGVDAKTSLLVDHSYGMTWNLPHPLCPPPEDNAINKGYNPAGEDFLFMHRQMVNGLRQAFMQAGLPCVRGWSEVPTTEEAALPDSDRSNAKSEQAFDRMRGWESYFESDEWLKSHSLSQVGFALEFSIHNNLHMRYATTAPPQGFSELASIGGAPLPMNNVYPSAWKYDSPSYNWLADPYGAAVNPTFWKIHGFVDDIINKWLAANSYSRAALDCQGDRKCYQWQGHWTGDASAVNAHMHALMVMDNGSRDPSSVVAGPVDAPTTEFTRQRMARQQLGVLQIPAPTRGIPQSPGGPVAAPAPAPEDPYLYVRSSVCHK